MTRGRDKRIAVTHDAVTKAIVEGENRATSTFNEVKAEARAAISEIGAMSAEAKVGIQNSEFIRGIAECDAELKKLAAMKADPHVEIDDAAFNVAAASILAKKEELERKIEIPVDMDRSAASRASSVLRSLNKDLDEGGSHLGNWISSLGKVRLQMGPISGTLRQFGLAFGLLGPLIVHLVGGLGSLIGVLGTGLTGAISVAGAGLAGFALSAVGAGIALRPVIHQLGVAWKATNMYHDAVQKYGKGSSQAADKQAQMNSALKGLPPQAQKSIAVLGQMRTQFEKIAGKGIRTDFFNSMAQGVKTAKALLPTFATESRRTFHAASEGVNQWFQALRSPEGRQAIADIMGGFRKALPDLMAGFGQLGAMMGHVFQSAAKQLPDLTSGFKQWATNLNQSVGSGRSLDDNMNRLVNHMQDLGHLAQATGRLLVNFFNAGANSGDGLLQSMTKAENRWSDWMNTAKGRNSLSDFFDRSAGGTRQFTQLLIRAGQLMVNISAITRPMGDMFLKVTGAAASLVNTLMGLAPTRVLLQGIGSALLAIFAVRKAQEFVKGIKDTIGAIRAWAEAKNILAASNAADTGATAANTGATEANTASKAEQAAATEAAMAAETGQTAALEANTAAQVENDVASAGGLARIGALGRGLTAFAGTTAGIATGVLVLGGAAAALAIHFRNADSLLGPFNGDIRDFYKGNRQATAATHDLTKAQTAQAESQKTINNLTEKGKTGTEDFAKAYDQHIASINAGRAAEQRRQTGIRQQTTSIGQMQSKYESLAATLKQEKAAGMDQGWQADNFRQQAAALASMSKQLNLAKLNFNRFQHGLGPVGSGFLASINKLRSAAGNKIALKMELSGTPAVLNHLANVTQRAKQLGATKAVMKILANSTNAEQAAARVDALLKRLHDKRVRITAEAGGAVSQTKALQAAIDALHDKTINIYVVQHGGAHGQATVHRASGDRSFGGGPAIVNERGPEMAMMNGAAWMLGNGRSGSQLDFVPRDAAILTARETAKLLSIGFPAFGKGKKPKKKKNGGGAGSPGPDSLADHTDADSDYQKKEDQVQLDAGLADLARRRYDLNQPGTSVQTVTDALQKEYDDYGALSGLIHTMLSGGLAKGVGVDPAPKQPKKRKNESNKAFNNRMKQYNDAVARRDAQQAHNQSVKDDVEGLQAEYDQIEQVTRPGLMLDILEAQNAANTNTILGQETANSARQNLFNQFASNVSGGVTSPSLGQTGLASASTTPALSSVGAGATGLAASVRSAAGPAAASSGATGGSATTVNIEQNFAAPPPDPHTYAQGVAFEIGASSA